MTARSRALARRGEVGGRARPTGLLEDALRGLAADPRKLPPKYFYDDVGARLFEQICELDEYYLTRTELHILRRHLPAMARAIGPDARVLEFGSGSGIKTRLLLRALHRPAEYVPIDISDNQLAAFADTVAREFPQLRVTPIAADYTGPLTLPAPAHGTARTVAFFPGSTLGNFEPADAQRFLSRICDLCGPGGGLLLGTDMHKDTAILERAYNDASGVTAAFNLNLLTRMNRECGADFRHADFRHEAVYDSRRRRIEMRLVARRSVTVSFAGRTFDFAAGDHILTEYSHKYTPRDVLRLARSTGWRVTHCWQDTARHFTVWLLRTRLA